MELIDNIKYLEWICLSWTAHSILMRLLQFSAAYREGKYLPSIVWETISCNKCFAFWTVSIITLNPITGAVVSAGLCLLSSTLSWLNSNSTIKL